MAEVYSQVSFDSRWSKNERNHLSRISGDVVQSEKSNDTVSSFEFTATFKTKIRVGHRK